jgi:amidohydrolase
MQGEPIVRADAPAADYLDVAVASAIWENWATMQALREDLMPVINQAADLAEQAVLWRHDIHQHPELLYDVHRTAKFVEDQLRSFGCDAVVPSIGRTGIVGVIQGRSNRSGRVIGLRADMDALPIAETTGLSYASQSEGKMHACGHDGHTAMLLGAARYLSGTRNFDGTAIVIFQPAEEGGAGAKAMVDDGLMDRFSVHEVYGLHNMPGLPVGQFAIRPGPLMAAADRFDIEVEGLGGHAAKPHECVDPIVIGSHIVIALQSIVSRAVDPLASAVVTVTRIHAGTAYNVIPQSVRLSGTTRTLTAETRDLIETRIRQIADGIAKIHWGTASVRYQRGYPVTENHPLQTERAVAAAIDVVGAKLVDRATVPTMGSEDFSYMLQARPGAFIFVGNGKSSGLHHSNYDFNDALIPIGISYWSRLVEMILPNPS